MQLAVVLYPGFTAQDMVGPCEILSRLPDTETVLVAAEPGLVSNDVGCTSVLATASFDEVTRPDLVLVPGGSGYAAQIEDGRILDWLREVDKTATWMVSVCTGTMILAATGLLSGRKAVTHWLAMEDLAAYGAQATPERVVIDGHYATGAGVSAGIDLGLTMAGRIAGDQVAQTLQLAIEYAPKPPYDAGTPETAPADVVEGLTSIRQAVLTGSF